MLVGCTRLQLPPLLPLPLLLLLLPLLLPLFPPLVLLPPLPSQLLCNGSGRVPPAAPSWSLQALERQAGWLPCLRLVGGEGAAQGQPASLPRGGGHCRPGEGCRRGALILLLVLLSGQQPAASSVSSAGACLEVVGSAGLAMGAADLHVSASATNRCF